MKLKFGEAVRVSWYDSMSQPGWRYNTAGNDIGSVAKIQSLGYAVTTTEEALVLTTSIGNRGGALDIVNIPWKSIVRLDRLGGSWDR